MSKLNPLAGIIANYGDSGDESEEDLRVNKSEIKNSGSAVTSGHNFTNASAAIHPAPIPHCPWSACYDESSGFTYYWNQQTNAVTWEAPPEYLLALKLAQQQLTASGSGEVSAEEWQLYQQALAEKQNSQTKAALKSSTKGNKKNDSNITGNKGKNNKFSKKRTHSEDEEEKIELITSYHNSDSDSNDEVDTPVKTPQLPVTKIQPKPNVHKKPKLKTLEYGPALPPNLNYTVPIGPELPPEISNNMSNSLVKTHAVKEIHSAKETHALKETNFVKETHAVKETHTVKETHSVKEDKPSKTNDDDSQDETTLLMKLKDKAKLLEKLGGEIPKELQQMIDEETGSGYATPKTDDSSKSTNTNIDDLLDEIERKELPKISKAKKAGSFEGTKSNDESSAKNSPIRDGTPPIEPRPLFPSFQSIEEAPVVVEPENEEKKVEVVEKKGVNLYLSNNNERIENVSKKKLRISNSVLPKREPIYTTKYSQFIEGFSNERVGLGFSKDDADQNVESSKNTISYGNGLMFTKGETLNDEKKDEDLDDMAELVEMKLKYLNQLQPCVLTPVQEMLVQMQTLRGAFRAGALGAAYWRRWAADARRQLAAHERRAAPPGWTCSFLRSEGRYCYRRESDGLVQWEYPATTHTDMEICTTPPHPGIETKEEVQPPLPPTPPPPRVLSPPALPPGAWRVLTPPPPSWDDPPPPGCDDLPPIAAAEPKQEIGDELASFYSDIAELEKVKSAPHTASNSPEPVEHKERPKEKEREREREKDVKVSRKKSKVKISSSVGLKHKSVSNLVAKWQQVAEEIGSD